MRAVGGLRSTSAIPPCAKHAADTLVVSCAECRASWAYRELQATAKHWRDRYMSERTARLAAERRCERST